MCFHIACLLPAVFEDGVFVRSAFLDRGESVVCVHMTAARTVSKLAYAVIHAWRLDLDVFEGTEFS